MSKSRRQKILQASSKPKGKHNAEIKTLRVKNERTCLFGNLVLLIIDKTTSPLSLSLSVRKTTNSNNGSRVSFAIRKYSRAKWKLMNWVKFCIGCYLHCCRSQTNYINRLELEGKLRIKIVPRSFTYIYVFSHLNLRIFSEEFVFAIKK